MRHIKKFESFKTSDLSEDISKDVYDKLTKIKEKRGEITFEYYEDWMKSFGADDQTIDQVFHNLVYMGFKFKI